MTNIIQKSIVLNSQNQLRNADRLAREWAIAHAGPYQGQARRELGGSGPFREWRNENIAIRIAKLTTGSYKQVQLVSVNYDHAGDAEPYRGYIMTYAGAEERPGGHCMSVVAAPDTLDKAQAPWDDKAGPVGLEKLIEAINADRSRPVAPAGGVSSVASINDLFPTHDTAIVLTEDGRPEIELQELADEHGGWADVVSVNAAEQLAISRELPDHQLPAWVRAKIALFSRYADAAGVRLRMAETDGAQAEAFIAEERDRVVNGAAGRNALELLKILESTSIMLSVAMLTDAKAMAEVLADAEAPPPTETGEADASDNVSAQQRVYLLEDRLTEAETTIAELRERLAQYEQYETDTAVDANTDTAPTPETVLDGNRYAAVLNAVTEPGRFPKLRFLTSWDKALADYGKPRPSGAEIVSALDAVNKLAQAWFNTPGGSIGPWDNYFNGLTGWSHANGESDFTMSRYGEKRSFSDQEHGRLVTIQRHLTYRGSSGGLQIYFDRDDVTDSFIVGYIGEHLPYATNRS